eukprot:5889138-Amphidinium_carterae.1
MSGILLKIWNVLQHSLSKPSWRRACCKLSSKTKALTKNDVLVNQKRRNYRPDCLSPFQHARLRNREVSLVKKQSVI